MTPQAKTSNSCVLCERSQWQSLGEFEDLRYALPGTFALARCRHCRLVSVQPLPSAAVLAKHYPDNYEPHRKNAHQHRGRAGTLLRRLLTTAPPSCRSPLVSAYNLFAYRALVHKPKGRMLDVGCGIGAYVQVWRDLGWEVEGIEVSPAAARQAREGTGAAIHTGQFESVSLEPQSYDLITMCHSLEHMPSPVDALKKARTLLRPTGHLLVMVPNFAAWDRHVFGPGWSGLEVPRHLYHFEPSSLRRMLITANFKVQHLGGTAHAGGLVNSTHRFLKRYGIDYNPGTAFQVAGSLVQLLPAMANRATSMNALASVQ